MLRKSTTKCCIAEQHAVVYCSCMNLGEKIRAARLEAGLTQSEVATHFGLTYQAVQRWENGTTHPGIKRLATLSRVLSKPIEYFISEPRIESLPGSPFISFRREGSGEFLKNFISPILHKTEKSDSERITDLERRVTRLETALKRLGTLDDSE